MDINGYIQRFLIRFRGEQKGDLIINISIIIVIAFFGFTIGMAICTVVFDSIVIGLGGGILSAIVLNVLYYAVASMGLWRLG